jgi:dipeptidyl aminopeptidase/acylaminoacyl peptidase
LRPEHLPWVRAGFAVLAYELNGKLPGRNNTNEAALRLAISQFLAAEAGLVNAKAALDYLAAKVPEVDPERVYSVGHSSAGTMSLLLAENDFRIKACVAFAPCVDVAKRVGPAAVQQLSAAVPGAADFFSRYNPISNEARLVCPVLLFHARDDSNVPVNESIDCDGRLRAAGKSVTLELVPNGDHYDSMIQEGIPRAIVWLRSHGANP